MISIEVLLACSCWFSNSTDACMAMGNAYYRYEKLDEMAEQFGDKVKDQYPPLFFTASLLSSYEKRKVNVPIYKGTYFGWEFPDRKEPRLNVGWSYGF